MRSSSVPFPHGIAKILAPSPGNGKPGGPPSRVATPVPSRWCRSCLRPRHWQRRLAGGSCRAALSGSFRWRCGLASCDGSGTQAAPDRARIAILPKAFHGHVPTSFRRSLAEATVSGSDPSRFDGQQVPGARQRFKRRDCSRGHDPSLERFRRPCHAGLIALEPFPSSRLCQERTSALRFRVADVATRQDPSSRRAPTA